MSDTEKLKRPPFPKDKVTIDERGRSVWTDPVETANFELVSTLRLKKILAEEQHGERDAVRKLAESKSDGYLAKDNATGIFSIIDTNELQKLLDADPTDKRTIPAEVVAEPLPPDSTDEELSLVSTQALRKILDIPDATPAKANARAKAQHKTIKDLGGGFDPYNTG